MKKTTLFRLFTFGLLVCLMASCSKNTDKPANPGNGNGNGNGQNPPPTSATYYVKMKLDDVQQSYTATVKAIRAEEDGTHMLQIQGIKGGGSTDEVDLLIFAPGAVGQGQYKEGDQADYFIMGVYAPQNRTDDMGIYYGGIHLDAAAPFTINVTEITSTYVKGTFSGTFYDHEGEGENKVVISNGEFKAPLQ